MSKLIDNPHLTDKERAEVWEQQTRMHKARSRQWEELYFTECRNHRRTEKKYGEAIDKIGNRAFILGILTGIIITTILIWAEWNFDFISIFPTP